MQVSVAEVVYECDNAIVAFINGERAYEVNGYRLTSSIRNGEGMEGTTWLLGVVFIPLTVNASGDIGMLEVTSHSRPVI